MIKYRYGINEQHELVDIFQLTKSLRHSEKIYCLSCGCQLVPVQGKVRMWHFRHAQEMACNGETYLHELSKELLRERFLLPNTPLRIPVKHYMTCCLSNQCKLPFDHNACQKEEIVLYDLKEDYDQILIEEPIGDFVADILLKDSTDRHPPFLIEIKVTHQCSDKKLKSGLPIYEIPITTENEAIDLYSGDLISGSLYNFTLPLSVTEKPIPRKWEIDSFVLYRSGKTHNERLLKSCSDVLQANHHDILLEYICLHPVSPYLRYQGFLMKAIELGFDIKDCRLCSKYRTPQSYDTSNICIMYKKEHLPKHPDVRSAYGCTHYSPVKAESIDSPINITVDNRIGFVPNNYIQVFSKEQERAMKDSPKELLYKNIVKEEAEEQHKGISRDGSFIKRCALSEFKQCFEKGNLKIAYLNPDNWQERTYNELNEYSDGYVLHNLKPLFQKCTIHDKDKKFCLELSAEATNVNDHLYFVFLYGNEAMPKLKRKSAYIIFIRLEDEFSVRNLYLSDHDILIKDKVNAIFINIEKLHEQLEKSNL